MGERQPIEKAPTDGTRVLVFVHGDWRIVWQESGEWVYEDGGDDWGAKYQYCYPKFWYSLPPKPARTDA